MDARVDRAIAAAANDVSDWRDETVRNWLFLILRFAITRDAKDRAEVLAFADEIDTLGTRWRRGAPRFFVRTSAEVCAAIVGFDDPNRRLTLRTHARRIDDSCLRRVFLVAVDLGENKMSPSRVGSKISQGGNMWRGLRGA